MSVLRAVPPVHSPISLRALLRGAAALRPRHDGRTAVEEHIRELYGAREVLLTDSGTAALTIALRVATRLRPGPVALPAYGCYDLLTACHGAGADIVFYDVRSDTLGPDPESVRVAVAGGAGVVVVAHLYGVPVDVEEIRALTGPRMRILVEDAAQGVGGSYRGKPLGGVGDLSVLSFARGKGRTGGAGGALLRMVDDHTVSLDAAAGGLSEGRRVSPLVAATTQWLFGRPAGYAIPRALPFLHLGETRYKAPREPARIAATAASVLSATWESADDEADRRRTHAAAYARLLRDTAVRTFDPPPGARAGYLRYPVLVPQGAAEAVLGPAASRLGIAPGYPLPLPLVRPRPGDRSADLDGTRSLVDRLVTLPTHGLLKLEDIERATARVLGGSEAE